MNASILTTADQLTALAPAWEELLGRSRSNSLGLSPTWLTTWWQVFGPLQGRRLRAVAFHEGDRLVGLAPLAARRRWYRPLLPFRRIEALGMGEPLDEAICTPYLDILAEEGQEPAVARSLADLIQTGQLGSWDEFVLEMLSADSPMPALLVEAFAGGRNTVTLEEYDRSCYLAIPPTWEAYLAGLDKKDRKFVKQTLQSFDEWAAGRSRFHLGDSPETLNAGRAALIALHLHRWNNTGKGTFRGAKFLAFHGRLMKMLLAEGKLHLAWLTVEGEPIAAAYCMRHAGRIWYYQAGRRLDVPEKIRPGIALVLMLIQRAIAEGRQEFDFLPGPVQYKSQLSSGSRAMLRLRVARPTWVEAVRAWSRRWLRSGNPGGV